MRYETSSPGAATRHEPAKGAPVLSRSDHALVRAVERELEECGIGAAVELLNGRTRFRYTGIYRAEPPRLRNVYLYDRENPTLNVSGAVTPIETTYCSITCATDAPFTTPDAGADPRLAAHPARESVISYAGVPLRLPGGRAWGTLCHFDVRPRLLPPHELDALASVAPVIARWAIAHDVD
jgi:GAF domain-containing protein